MNIASKQASGRTIRWRRDADREYNKRADYGMDLVE
jgi:hypothetical protein